MYKYKSKVRWCIYIAPLSLTSQRRFTMINLPPADWKHIQAQIAAASKQSMHAGTQFTDLGRMESWVNFSGKEGRQIFQSRQNREWAHTRTEKNSDQGGNWTHDLRVRSPPLYRLSYKVRREQAVGIWWHFHSFIAWATWLHKWIVSSRSSSELKPPSSAFFGRRRAIIPRSSTRHNVHCGHGHICAETVCLLNH